VDQLRKEIKNILDEMWQHMTASEMISNYGRASSSKPMIPFNQRMNDYEQLALQDDIIGHSDDLESYEWKGPNNVGENYIYSFDTHEDKEDRNADFIVDVVFSEHENSVKENTWKWEIKTAAGEDGLLKNRTRISRVFSTFSDILTDFIKNHKPSIIVYKPMESENATQKSINYLFLSYLEDRIPLGYIYKEHDGSMVLTKKDFNTSFSKLKQLLSPPPNTTGRVNPDFSGY